MTDPEDLTFDEEAAVEAAQERRAVPHLRDFLKREQDRLLKGYSRDVALEKWCPELEEMMTGASGAERPQRGTHGHIAIAVSVPLG